jgi:hypothetical protein
MGSIRSWAKALLPAIGLVTIVAAAQPAHAAVWIPGHYGPYGRWIPGHWAVAVAPRVVVVPRRVWVPGFWAYGYWHPGHWVIR